MASVREGTEGFGLRPRSDRAWVSTLPARVLSLRRWLSSHSIARSERSRAVALDFETVEREPALPVGHSLTITGVERDGDGICIMYMIHPPLSRQAGGPHGKARDDGDDIGSAFGGAERGDGTTGVLRMPLPTTECFVVACAHELVGGLRTGVGTPRAQITNHTLSFRFESNTGSLRRADQTSLCRGRRTQS